MTHKFILEPYKSIASRQPIRSASTKDVFPDMLIRKEQSPFPNTSGGATVNRNVVTTLHPKHTLSSILNNANSHKCVNIRSVRLHLHQAIYMEL